MRRQQQSHSHYQRTSINGLSVSGVSAWMGVSSFDTRLPSISQPLISRYRGEKLKVNLLGNKTFDSNIFTDFFCGKESDTTVSMCEKCQRSKEMNMCVFMLQLVEQRYDWRNDMKFRSSYQFYNKKRIPVFLTDQQIQYRIMSKFSTLGVILLDNHKLLLMRIIKNYIKHTIYYGQQKRLSLQNDYYFWFLIGIYYHIGVPKYLSELESLPRESIGLHEPMMFWLLDAVMKKLGDCTQESLRKNAQMTLKYAQFFFSKECNALAHHDINLHQIFHEWTTQAMMGYMGIQFIGFYAKSILKEGFQYIQKTILSYFQKRVIKLDKDEIISFNQQPKSEYLGMSIVQESKHNKKEQVMKVLLDSNQEWPGIFFTTNVYQLKE